MYKTSFYCFLVTSGMCPEDNARSSLTLGIEIKQCLKITEKVSFNIASEASLVYTLSEQKFIKNAKNGRFGESNSVAREVTF